MSEADADDDDLDDASLRSMRAVWLSMRDEEPPAAGMSGLLAAAREKAEQMREANDPPRWWRRMLALIRRPPALAFATVLVLIGGAVLVTRNTGDKVESQVAAEPPHAQVQAGAVAPASSDGVAPSEEETEAKTAEAAVNDTSEPPPPPETTADQRQRKIRKPRPAAANGSKKQERDEAEDDSVKESVDLGDNRQGPERGFDGRGTFGGTTLGTVPSTQSPGQAKTTKPMKPDDVKDAPVPASTVTEDVEAEKPKTPPAQQLEQQARSAATRGDCAAVRVIVARIKQQDERYYRSRIEKDAALKKCL